MKILSFGEILYDIIDGNSYIGGAPFNLSAHLAKMRIDSSMISSVGSDKLGNDALKIARDFGVNTEYMIIDQKRETGTVNVVANKNGQNDYQFSKDPAWEHIVLNESILNKLSKFNWDVFCFGTLAQCSATNKNTLRELLNEISFKYIYYDINLRKQYYNLETITYSLQMSNIVKLNDEELEVISKLILNSSLREEDFLKYLIDEYNLIAILITKGADGACVYYDGHYYCTPGIKVDVEDTVGAGDAFSAGFLFYYLKTDDIFNAIKFGCKIGAYVASKKGAVPNYSEEIIKEIKKEF